MAYIGARPVNGFFSKQDISTDGSTTTFALDFTVSSTSSIIVSVGGVIQEPDTAYTLSGGNTSIVFSEAPSATADTDDEIDFKIGGSDVITFKATGIHLPDGEKYFSGTGLSLIHI